MIATTLMLIGAIGSSIAGFQTLFNLYQLALVAGILTILAWGRTSRPALVSNLWEENVFRSDDLCQPDGAL